MNKTEYILTCISEECSEVQQAISKALRFGLDDFYPSKKEGNNLQDLIDELNDLSGVLLLAKENNILPEHFLDADKVVAKRDKILKYMDYSKNCGTLQD